MTLPFTLEQFLDVFAAYNRLLWPAALLLWIASLGAFILLLRGDVRATRLIGWLLVVHWSWSGAVYHLAHFRDINPAAVVFGVLFLAQAGLFAWWTRGAPAAAFHSQPTAWTWLGRLLMGYAIAYPALGLVFGLSYPRMPTFGVPCPTTLFTVGALLVARAAAPRWLGLIPLAWTVVGGSAAFLFDVSADLALPVAGAVLLVSMLLPRHGRQLTMRGADKHPRRQVALLPVAVLAAFYATVGITFALPTTHVGIWRVAAWVVSGLAYGAHLLYEHYWLRSTARVAALHVATAAALGALGLAIGALVRSISAGMPAQHQRLLLIALVLWPLITGVPAFVVGLAASALLSLRTRARRSQPGRVA